MIMKPQILKITDEAVEKVSLLEENIKPRSDLPPLLVHIRDISSLHFTYAKFQLNKSLRVAYVHAFKANAHTYIEVNGSDELEFHGPFYRE
nr:RNA cytidine acetyltransferase 1-like isoform X2 [Tanacetum cinerariifolium]